VVARGLTSEAAARRLAEVGPNDPVRVPRTHAFAELARACANWLVVILLVASVASASLGQEVDAALIATIVVVSVAIDFAQAYRSQRAAARLRDIVAPTATLLRDGAWSELPRRCIVPGDVFRLAAGDLVPADARLLESRDLHVQQAALTGESIPVEKQASATAAGGPLALDDPGAVFLGTSVVSGSATAVAVTTGAATVFGGIAARLAARAPETEFDRGTRRFGVLIMETVTFLVVFVVIAGIAAHRDPLQSVLFAVALAVGLTPEFLPMITTVTLSRGAVHMARKHVIVKHLAAIQNLGSIDVLCSDKTGTLTVGAVAVDERLDAAGEPSARPLELAHLNSAFESGIKSPLDAAILACGGSAAGWRKTDEIPFDFERRRLSVVVERDGAHLLVVKGAPEGLVERCIARELGGRREPLDDAARARCADVFRDRSARGARVLAVAYRDVDRADGFTADDERDLVLAGFLTFRDPPAEGVADTLRALARDGVRVKVVTGDNELVTRHLCREVGLACETIVLGEELERTTDAALAHVVEQCDVFARVSPAQKNRIIRALKGRSHVVGFLGDGINDAPSLHAADVGISVASAVDVAKDAAEIILLQPGLAVLHSGILEGRRAFGNVLKYLLMGTSSNFGNMFSMAGAAVFLPFLPMLPIQILLNNFLYDLAQVTIPTDRVDPVYIERPQRWDVRVIRDFMLVIGPISSAFDFLTFAILLRVFHSTEAQFHTGWFVESLATQALVLFVIRTAGPPWSQRPSAPLAITTIGVVVVGIYLPFSPAAGALGFTPLPPAYFAFLGAATISYLSLVELAKRRLVRRLIGTSPS
jgi:Mg2+-importing ATPase